MWIKKYTRPSNVQYDELIRGSGLFQIPLLVSVIKSCLGFPVGKGFLEFYIQENEWDNLMEKMSKKMLRGRNFYQRYVQDYRQVSKQYYKSALPFKKDLTKLSNRQLFNLYQNFVKSTRAMCWFFYSVWAINEVIEPAFKKKIIKKFGAKAKKILLAINSLTQTIRFDQQLKELLILKDKGNINQKTLQAHVQKWGYLKVYAPHHQPFKSADFLKMIKGVKPKKQLKEIIKGLKENQKQYQQALQLLKINEGLFNLARLINLNIYLRNERMDLYREVTMLVKPFYQELDRRLGLANYQSSFLTIDEINQFLLKNKKPNFREIKERAKIKYAWYCQGKTRRLILNQAEIKKLYKKKLGSKEKYYELNGMVAYPAGKVRGRVRIVISVHDELKFCPKEILVTPMTRPEYTNIMKKAAAIVTDEGGVTCHAAVLSRELKIPCVIGTKIATKVLKDGDMVEVDANKGIIKKLK
ncbi:hypothetical protein KKF32_02105 [Patescibacteria group bacterium]|nr:hypothetical protein [Patescibacteria group bacterium]